MIPVPYNVLAQLSHAYQSDASSLTHFSGGREESDGILYAFPYQDRHRLLKILVIPLDQEQKGLFYLEERLRFARYAGENGIKMVFPQLSPQGRLYETHLDEAHVWVAYAMEIAPGHIPREEDQTPQFFQDWGQTVGKLHRLSQDYPTWQAAVLPETGQECLNWQEEWQSFYDMSPTEAVRSKWLELRTRLEALPASREAMGFVHNDPHIWNLLVKDGSITLLDFDVANHHWFINDIAIACMHVLFDQSGGISQPVHNRQKLVDFLRHFMEGYRRENDLAGVWLDQLDLFFTYRRLLLYTVMQGWIQSQPELKASWEQMILEQPEVLGAVSGEI